jgi:hypothetical protein
VCDASGALHGISAAQAIVSCVVNDAAAYERFLQCGAGTDACSARSCARSYLAEVATGPHSADVRGREAQFDRECTRVTQQTNDFAVFQSCVAKSSNPCDKYKCIQQFSGKLPDESYASTMRSACIATEEAAAFGAFNQCVTRSASACDHAACGGRYFPKFKDGLHADDVNNVLNRSQTDCAIKTAFDDFNSCLTARRDACGQMTSVNLFGPRLKVEPYVTQLRQKGQQLSDACKEDEAFAEFNRCIGNQQCNPGRQQCARDFKRKFGSTLRARNVDQIAAQDSSSCRPPPKTPEDAAKQFVRSFYVMLADGSDLQNIYAPSVVWYRNETMSGTLGNREHQKYRKDNWDVMQFSIESMNADCPDRTSCRVTGRYRAHFHRGTRVLDSEADFEITVVNPLTAPRISAEWAKKVQ